MYETHAHQVDKYMELKTCINKQSIYISFISVVIANSNLTLMNFNHTHHILRIGKTSGKTVMNPYIT